MDFQQQILDRLARLETKMDILLEERKDRRSWISRATIALVSSVVAVLIAVFK